MAGRDRSRRLAALAVALPIAGCGLLEALTPPPPAWATVRGERSEAPPAAPLRTVLVLPIASHDAVPAHAEALRTAFAQVLRNACGFDVVSPDVASLPRATRDELLSARGREAGALVRFHREWGADAVLFGRLAFSRPHGEPGIGLELELVDARDGTPLWRAQDVVDARDPAVRASLLRFRELETGAAMDDVTQIPFESFTRFVAASFLRTLFAPLPGPPDEPAGASPVSTQRTPGNGFPSAADR